MSYQRFGRGRGFGLGFGRRFGFNPAPYRGHFLETKRGWWTNPMRSNYAQIPIQEQPQNSQQINSQHLRQYPPRNTPSYQYIRPVSQTSYQKGSVQGMLTHMTCFHYQNGFCSLNNMPVDPNGLACQSYTPRQ
jgi:hypothetical protein